MSGTDTPPDASIMPHGAELELLARRGENAAVVEKKALLAWLASAEAERAGIAPGPREVQAVADALRAELGLHDARATRDWLAAAGLDEAGFAAIAADFAAVLAVAAHHRAGLAPRIERHRRFIEARARHLADAARAE